MRGRMARSAFALGSTGLLVLGIAGCNQSAPAGDSGSGSSSNLKIVEQVQIDENGAEVKAASGAAPADPTGDGKATCPPVSIAMAGALNGPDAALGINIKNGVQLAIDKHNAANPGCQ
ncbi:MAG: branched-chain amino acid transport system substrate-binding protein, partial [Mycobacterium sp.]|nr:branched-chain amino acid transport system substrate-binding protein [Mycobacterium sp.]